LGQSPGFWTSHTFFDYAQIFASSSKVKAIPILQNQKHVFREKNGQNDKKLQKLLKMAINWKNGENGRLQKNEMKPRQVEDDKNGDKGLTAKIAWHLWYFVMIISVPSSVCGS
jgi:hypothetical protein